MERTNADLVKQIHAEKERVRMLEDRFNELAGNHQDMIKFKVSFFLSPTCETGKISIFFGPKNNGCIRIDFQFSKFQREIVQKVNLIS